MVQTVQSCSKCSRANPGDAVYCYYDGMVLDNTGRRGGPVAVGSQAFNSPFVFPSGQTCRNFNELALACENDWSAAKEVLKQGFLGSFFGALGRVDLAMAAKQAAAFPDHDRGLDDLLGKLPADVLQPPKLALETQEINLGNTPFGSTRKLQLKMENSGGRLLHGTVTCRDGWISFGDQPGISTKTFQFMHELTLPVMLVGDRLRASSKPIETQIVIDSSGGTKTVVVRAEVPIKPFAMGVLAGAKIPRQIAEKAKGNPKEAAVLFEKGEVRNWYRDNGWIYPVKGRDSSGLGAVQQFFEVLGLTPPPKVAVSQHSIALSGNPGQQLQHLLEVKSEEKRPVYADGSCDVPWLEVGKAKLNGRVATIPLLVPSVPNTPGQTMTAKLTVLSNGNQRFVVPITLKIGGTYIPGAPIPVQAIAASARGSAATAVAVMPAVGGGGSDNAFAMMDDPEPVSVRRNGGRSGPRPATKSDPGTFMKHLIPAGVLLFAVLCVFGYDLINAKPHVPDIAETSRPKDSNIKLNLPTAVTTGDEFKVTADLWDTKEGQTAKIRLPEGLQLAPGEKEEKSLVKDGSDPVHVAWRVRAGSKPGDYAVTASCEKISAKSVSIKVQAPPEKPDTPIPVVAGNVDVTDPKNWKWNLKDPVAKLRLNFNDDARFGLEMAGIPDTREDHKNEFKKLTSSATGENNNTIVLINDYPFRFGSEHSGNAWVLDAKKKNHLFPLPYPRIGSVCEMKFTKQRISVRQHVEIVPNRDGVLDTCLIYYIIKNYGTASQKVGIRVMMDTFIGSNDGVPFTIPGQRGFVTGMKVMPQKEIPNYIEAIENPEDPNNLGTVARMTLKGLRLPGVKLEPMDKAVICRWPYNKNALWGGVPGDWQYEPMDINPDNKDSCVLVYWPPEITAPDEERRMAFTYGLGGLGDIESPSKKPTDSAMALSVPSSAVVPGDVFYVTAYLWNTHAGQKASIHIPDGLQLADDQGEKTLEQFGPKRVQVAWKVKGTKPGTYKVTATSENAKTKPRDVKVEPLPEKGKPQPQGPSGIFG